VKRTFCPPKESYDPKLNADGRYGRPRCRFVSEILQVEKYNPETDLYSLSPVFVHKEEA
jgi:hypothetical protein